MKKEIVSTYMPAKLPEKKRNAILAIVGIFIATALYMYFTAPSIHPGLLISSLVFFLLVSTIMFFGMKYMYTCTVTATEKGLAVRTARGSIMFWKVYMWQDIQSVQAVKKLTDEDWQNQLSLKDDSFMFLNHRDTPAILVTLKDGRRVFLPSENAPVAVATIQNAMKGVRK